jgi:hypothetical protein
LNASLVVVLEYKADSDLIPRNASVVIVRRPRENLEPLTPATNPQLIVSCNALGPGFPSFHRATVKDIHTSHQSRYR